MKTHATLSEFNTQSDCQPMYSLGGLVTVTLVVCLSCIGCGDAPRDVVNVPGGGTVDASNWPCWRGLLRDGKSHSKLAPTEWSEDNNVVWKQKVEGRGYSSPTVWGDRIFLTTSDPDKQKQIALCFDRNTGKPVWSIDVHQGGFVDKMQVDCSYANSTPACDGKQAYFTFLNAGAIWLTAIDFKGNTVWQQKIGSYKSMDGFAASPQLYRETIIVGGDNVGPDSFLAAVDRKSGRIVWKVPRPAFNNVVAPLIAHVGGRDQILLCGGRGIAGYAADTGTLLWVCTGFAQEAASTMTYDGEVVYANGGFPYVGDFCIRADGSGNVTKSHLVWRENLGPSYASSLLVHEGVGYSITDKGILSCFDAATGKRKWRARLEGGFYSSPILAGDNFYLQSKSGSTYVIRHSPESFELIAENKLPEGGYASPVICGGQIYLRTDQHLYCIGSLNE